MTAFRSSRTMIRTAKHGAAHSTVRAPKMPALRLPKWTYKLASKRTPKAAKQLEKMRREAGRLLILGLPGPEVDEATRHLLRECLPGGVILFKRNITDPQQIFGLLRQCVEMMQAPLFRCVDLEGGTVDRLRDVFGRAPSAASVFATHDPRLFRIHGEVIGTAVHSVGFQVDFAPVLDLAFAASQKVMGSRLVSANAEEVIQYAREFLRGLRAAGVFGCGKHFPGLGAANLDTHDGLAVIAKPWKQLWAEDMLPYQHLQRQLAFVMMAHAAYPAVTRKAEPASLSKRWISGILRQKVGYRGLVMVDDLDMGAVLAAADANDAARQAIVAGADTYLICQRPERALEVQAAVVKEMERSVHFREQVRHASGRVLRTLRRMEKLSPLRKAPTTKVVEQVRRQLADLREAVELAAPAMQQQAASAPAGEV